MTHRTRLYHTTIHTYSLYPHHITDVETRHHISICCISRNNIEDNTPYVTNNITHIINRTVIKKTFHIYNITQHKQLLRLT